MKNKILISSLILMVAGCSWFKKDDNGDNGGGDSNKVCLHFSDEAAKEAIIAEHGKSCKVGDWWGVGDATCSSSEDACKKK